MKKRTVATLSLLLVAVICCATVVYAFFQEIMPIGSGKEPVLTVEDDGESTVAVYTEQQLYKATQDTFYNPHGTISEKRVTVKFEGNITLTSNLLITADVNLNLNGFTLYLNGHSVTVSHDYMGTFVVENGYLFQKSDSFSKFYINTPNADTALKGVIFTDASQSALDSSEYIVYINADKKIIAYNVFYMIAGLLKSGYTQDKERIDYGKVFLALDGRSEEDIASNNYSRIKFNSASYYCPFEEDAICYCYYIGGNIDLPLSYHNYALKIEYSSVSSEGESDLINDRGEVTFNGAQAKKVTLTARISFINSSGESEFYACYDYDIILISPDDALSHVQLARARVLDYLRNYLGYYDTDGDGEKDFLGYSFSGEISLPSYEEMGGVTFIYEVFDQDDLVNAVDTTRDMDGGVSEREYFRTVGNAYIFAVSADINFLRVTCQLEGETLSTSDLRIRGQAITIEDNYSVAQNIIAQWYSNEIVITNDSVMGINEYTYQTLYYNVSEFASKGVLSVDYDLSNNVDGTYGFSADKSILHIVAGKHPNELQRVYLTATFEFEDERVSISIPVVYDPDTTGGGNSQIHAFLPYYIYLNRVFKGIVGASTYLSFDMPLYYPAGSPAVVYDIAGDSEGAITLQIYYNGVAHDLFLGSYASYTDAFDAHLAANGLTLNQLIAYGDAKWTFNIDIDQIGKTDCNISVKYNYKFGSKLENSYDYTGMTQWISYDAADSSFILPGILRTVYTNGNTDETGVIDTVFYKWIYDNYNLKGDSYSFNSDKYTKYVMTSWLTKEMTINNNANVLSITNYKGIEYLAGVKALYLNDIGTSTANTAILLNAVKYIAQMQGLEELYLSNNGLYDRAQSSAAFPTGDDNDFIGVLSALSGLKILDLSNNKIFDFTDLASFASIEVVYTYGNSHTSTISWAAIRDVLTNLSNSTYGSMGSTNTAVYQQLYLERGVVIYHISATESYTGGSSASDYAKMKNIVYQDVLPQGVSIETVYQYLSTNPADYGITKPYEDDKLRYWSITFSYSGSAYTATEFTMTYSYEAYLQTGGSIFSADYEWIPISISAKFSVTRLSDGTGE